MAKKDPTKIKEKWKRKMRAATEDMREGVEALTESPAKKAIEQKELLKKKLIEAIDSGIWEKQLGKVTLDEWKKAYIEAGIPRISSGVEKADKKMEDFFSWLVDAVEAAKGEIKTKKDGTIESSIARASEFIRAMHKRKYKGR